MSKRRGGAVAETEQQLVPGIRIERVALADLEPDPDNERQHDAKNIEAIAASLVEFGQVLPLLVRGRRIIGGHGTREAMLSLGWSHADVARAEHLTDVQVAGLRIALNRTAELATWDQLALHRSLQELAAFRVEWPKTLGFSDVDLTAMESAVCGMGSQSQGGSSAIRDQWPSLPGNEFRSFVFRYRKDDLPVLLAFLGRDELPFNRTGEAILERIREVATGSINPRPAREAS